MSQVAVVNRAPGLDDFDVAFWAAACNAQAREVAAAHGVSFTPVVFYSQAEGLPTGCRVMAVVPTLNVPGALGWHDFEVGSVLGEVKYSGPGTSVTLSHESAEEEVDPFCNRWAPFDADHEQAVEVSDRVEGDTYLQSATVLGETRQVLVSNYLLPSAFDPGGQPPFDRMGKLFFWNDMTKGGYAVVRDVTTGKVGNIFARRGPSVVAGPAAQALLAEKLGRPGGRLLQRLRG